MAERPDLPQIETIILGNYIEGVKRAWLEIESDGYSLIIEYLPSPWGSLWDEEEEEPDERYNVVRLGTDEVAKLLEFLTQHTFKK